MVNKLRIFEVKKGSESLYLDYLRLEEQQQQSSLLNLGESSDYYTEDPSVEDNTTKDYTSWQKQTEKKVTFPQKAYGYSICKRRKTILFQKRQELAGVCRDGMM